MQQGPRKIRVVAATIAATAALALPIAAARAEVLPQPGRWTDPGRSQPAERRRDGARPVRGRSGRRRRSDRRRKTGHGRRPVRQGLRRRDPQRADRPRSRSRTEAAGGDRRHQRRRTERRRTEQEEATKAKKTAKAPKARSIYPHAPLTIPILPTSSCASAGVPPVLIPVYQQPPRPTASARRAPRCLPHQRGRERLRHQHRNLLRRRRGLDAVHALDLGDLGSTPTATGSRIPTTLKTRSSPPPVTSPPPGCRQIPTARSSPTTMPTGTSPRFWPTPGATPRKAATRPRSRPHPADQGSLPTGAGMARTGPRRIHGSVRDAAGRYELGKRGVWALAAVARLESSFGRRISKEEMKQAGRSVSKPWSGAYASTATKTATSAATTSPIRQRRWPARSGRRARSRPASSPTTRPSGTSRRCSRRPKR